MGADFRRHDELAIATNISLTSPRYAAIMFFGPKITTVFASRWKALGWSAGVLMTAYCSIPSNDQDSTNSAAVDPAVAAVAGLMGASASTLADSPASPWAKTLPASPNQ